MRELLLVAIGGAIGALGRYWMSGVVYRLLGSGFPYGTVAVNVLGSLAMGMVFVAVERSAIGDELRLLIAVGILGAFTTFSTFSIDTLVLVQQGGWGRAVANVAVSVTVCLAACAFGIALARRL